MDFKEASDRLFAGISHGDLARMLGVSVALIRQARLGQSANAWRSPPVGWQAAMAMLAERQARDLQELIKELAKSPTVSSGGARKKI
jgi:hypothetical protein